MGRRKKEIDPLAIHALSSQGMTQKEMAKELGVSHVTLAKRMADLKAKQGVLLKYRSLQTLDLTSLQSRILDNITPEKMKEASLVELATAFKILKKAELGMEPDKGPGKISGLVGYLIQIEKEEMERKSKRN